MDLDPPAASSSPPTVPLKIIVAGAAGVGKTTFVGSVSEVSPLDTATRTTEAGKATTTVAMDTVAMNTGAMDVGRIALDPDLVLSLLGTAEAPPSLLSGALGAVVLVDARQIEESFAVVDYFEEDSEVPFIVAVNMFDGRLAHDIGTVRDALALIPEVPLTTCDARDPKSTAKTLLELVSYARNLAAPD
ncbi:MAG: ATP-binding protein [Actinomycetota bacterium]|nr:ATP-binding protein [Actinomycetota bacterium]